MKKLPGENFLSVILSGLVLLSLVRCGSDGLENPGYPVVPSIKFEKLKLIEVGDIYEADTLKITISYKDGDSDLGLDPYDENDYRFPYHSKEYFLEDGTGDTIPVRKEPLDSWFGINSIPRAGILVTDATRENDNYNYLPLYNSNSCLNYENWLNFYVREDLHIIDESFDILDTTSIHGINLIEISEVLLYRDNENFNNIFVEFYVLKNGAFEKFTLFEESCITVNDRFPLIADKKSGTIKSFNFNVKINSPWEGTITYSMPNTSFLDIFSDTPIKLAITIKDRALNKSNTVVTPEFTLEDIK